MIDTFFVITITVPSNLTCDLFFKPHASLQIESDDDILWKLDVRELNEELAERGLKFLNW